MKRVTLGIIGIGNIRGSHIAALEANPEYELVGVCRREKEALDAIAADLGVPGYTDYHDLLAQRPDVIVNCLPHGMHCAVTLEALAAGCHVLVEKPMAVSVDECNRMLAAAREHGKHLVVTEAAYHYPGAQLTGRRFAAGDLGRFFTGSIINHRAYFNADRPGWFLDPAMSGGGMFANVGLHRLAVARACLPGLEAVRVAASVSHQDDIAVEACTSALVRYDGGGAMLYEEVGYYPRAGWLNHGTHLVFEHGVVSWDDKTWRLLRRDGREVTEPLAANTGYAPVYANMLAALSGKGPDPTAAAMVRDVAIVQAAYASARLGQEIDLTSPDWAIREGG